MLSETCEKIVVGLETSFGGGSISILKGTSEIDFVKGSREGSKSEEILEMLEEILRKNNINKKEIDLIVVSNGPGSLTGGRVSVAIAKGLRTSLKVNIKVLSVLEALTLQSIGIEREVISAIYTLKTGVILQRFQFAGTKKKEYFGKKIENNKNLREFVEKIGEFEVARDLKFVFSQDLVSAIETEFKQDIKKIFHLQKVVSVEGSFAKLLGLAGRFIL